ncbi:tannase/feruloyl esterase family alpha/beta hydrolase [Mycobacterium syngnathidarum]
MEELGEMQEIGRVSDQQWLPMPRRERDALVVERCQRAVVAKVLGDLPGVQVRDVKVNQSGVAHIPASVFGIPGFTDDDVPEYCSVQVEHRTAAGHVSVVDVWVPLVWNGRFLGTGGAGSRLTIGQGPLLVGVKNGFATACTDGGLGEDQRIYDWQFNADSKQNDATLITNWAHASTHDMTVIGKAVTTAIHGFAPAYSYFQGSSGGGRQALASAMYHPADYDGVWSSMPAINWTRLASASLWPALVMKELDNAVPAAKLEAFRQAAVFDFNQRNGTEWPFIASVASHPFDPFTVVGKATDAGVISDSDARVMQMIWDGPRKPDGERLWFGVRPGVETWGAMVPNLGLCVTKETGSGLVPDPGPIAVSWFQTWLLEDPEWDWTTLTFEEYFRLFEMGLEKFAHISMDNADLSAFRDNGSKLLITHGTDDQVISPEGTCHYFDRVIGTMGGSEEASRFARLFLSLGEGHGFTEPGRFAIDMATGMTALMNWVERGIAPDELMPMQVGSADAVTDSSLAVRYGT